MCPQLVVKTKYIDTLIKLLLYFTLLYLRLILNRERTLLPFSETSFEKQCHKGLTRVIQPEKVASRIRWISTQPRSLLVWQIGMCWMLQRMGELLRNMSTAMARSVRFFGELVNALYLALTFGAYQPML